MKARYIPFSAKIRRYRHLAKEVNRMLENGTFHLLTESKKKKLLYKLRERLKSIGHLVPQPRLREALAGIALLLGTAFANPLEAQSFALPISAPFGLQAGLTSGYPTFADIDNDGDQDLFLVSYDNTSYSQYLSFFENVGTPESPSFVGDAPAINPFNVQWPGYVTTIVFADLDDDGDQDLILGSYDYYNSGIFYMENTGTPEFANFGPVQYNPFGIANSGSITVPAVVDMDGDGDLDLISGDIYGVIKYFENTGTPQAPAFAPVTDNPFGLTVNAFLVFPNFADMDNDGDQDFLYMGYTFGAFMYYQQNNGTPELPAFGSAQFSPFGLSTAGVDVPIPTLADIDNDGDTDFFYNDFYSSTMYFQENLDIGVNYPPTAADGTVTAEEDEAYFFKTGDFNFMDANLSDQLQAVEIVSLPGLGELKLNGNPVSAFQVITAAELPNLSFETFPNDNGTPYTNFGFRVFDGEEWSAGEYVMTINVTPVNDFPESTNAGILGNQDMSYSFSPSDFPFDDVDGNDLAAVRIVSLPAKGKLQFNGTDATVNQVIPAAFIPQLTFAPAAGEFGIPYTEFQFQVSDGTLFSVNDYTMVVNIQQASASNDRALNAVVKLSPNPASNLLLLNVEANRALQQSQALISNELGQAVLTFALPENAAVFSQAIDISNLTPGWYFLKIQSGEQWRTVRFVKE